MPNSRARHRKNMLHMLVGCAILITAVTVAAILSLWDHTQHGVPVTIEWCARVLGAYIVLALTLVLGWFSCTRCK